MPVESKKPIVEEDTLEEECEDEMITVTPFSIEPEVFKLIQLHLLFQFFLYVYSCLNRLRRYLTHNRTMTILLLQTWKIQ